MTGCMYCIGSGTPDSIGLRSLGGAGGEAALVGGVTFVPVMSIYSFLTFEVGVGAAGDRCDFLESGLTPVEPGRNRLADNIPDPRDGLALCRLFGSVFNTAVWSKTPAGEVLFRFL